jgi:hypothetical protein
MVDVSIVWPTATIVAPVNGATYDLGASVPSAFTCSDNATPAGTFPCVGTVAVGQTIDTSTIAAHTFTVNATDGGGLTSTTTSTYSVSSSIAAGLALTGTFTTIPAGFSVTVTDEGIDGVTITVTGSGTSRVVMQVCGGFTVRISAGSTVTLACGSVIAKVATGSVVVERTTATGLVTMTVIGGGSARLTDSGNVTVAPTSTSAVTVTSAGQAQTVTAGTSLAMTIGGFYAPITAGVNTQRAGATVPVKFDITYGALTISDVRAVASLTATKASCATWLPTAPASNVGPVRFDADSRRFQANWRTPNSVGACYLLSATTTSGASISARFKL